MSSAIVKGFSKLHTLKKQEYAKTWFSRILINECQMILRKRKREVTYEEGVLTEEARTAGLLRPVSASDAARYFLPSSTGNVLF